MYRFQQIKTDKEVMNVFVDALNKLGFRQVPDITGGDHAFL